MIVPLKNYYLQLTEKNAPEFIALSVAAGQVGIPAIQILQFGIDVATAEGETELVEFIKKHRMEILFMIVSNQFNLIIS